MTFPTLVCAFCKQVSRAGACNLDVKNPSFLSRFKLFIWAHRHFTPASVVYAGFVMMLVFACVHHTSEAQLMVSIETLGVHFRT